MSFLTYSCLHMQSTDWPADALVPAPVTLHYFYECLWAHPPCLLRLDFISCHSHCGLSSLPAVISSAFVGNDTRLNGALHTLTTCLYCSSNLQSSIFWCGKSLRLCDKTCNYLLNIVKIPRRLRRRTSGTNACCPQQNAVSGQTMIFVWDWSTLET